jgi:hypothetical protein
MPYYAYTKEGMSRVKRGGCGLTKQGNRRASGTLSKGNDAEIRAKIEGTPTARPG